jgi:hypothetical protein
LKAGDFLPALPIAPKRGFLGLCLAVVAWLAHRLQLPRDEQRPVTTMGHDVVSNRCRNDHASCLASLA